MTNTTDIRITDQPTKAIVEQFRRERGYGNPTAAARAIIQEWNAWRRMLPSAGPETTQDQPAEASE